jgi:hypothetical protein
LCADPDRAAIAASGGRLPGRRIIILGGPVGDGEQTPAESAH